MKFSQAEDLYLDDRQRSGHITSPESVRTYRFFLDRLASDVGNRDPSLVGYQDIKRTLARWPNPNTYGQARTAINGMFKWLVAEGYVKTNPVDRIQAPRKKRVTRARLTKAEMRAIMDACRNDRERRAIYLTACSGLRNREIRLLEGRHFARPGFIWVSPDIGKGGRERWLPVSPDLQPVVEEIIRNVALDQLVLPSLRSFNPGVNTDMRPVRRARPCHPTASSRSSAASPSAPASRSASPRTRSATTSARPSRRSRASTSPARCSATRASRPPRSTPANPPSTTSPGPSARSSSGYRRRRWP
jgi:integrase